MGKIALIGGGALVMLFGLASAAGNDCDIESDDFGSCLESKRSTMFVTAGFGLALTTAGILVKLHPAPPDEIRRLADEYNDALRRRLSAPPPTTTAAAPTLELEVTPMALGGGGGLAVGLRF